MGLAKLAWLLVPAVGITELAGHFYFSSGPASLDEWRAVRSKVASLRKQGELVVVAPRWAEPNARAAFGDALMPLADVARADESAHARAIEVSTIGKDAPELAGWKLVHEEKSGKFRLRVLDNPRPARVTFDFLEHASDAVVTDLLKTGERPCPWTTTARRDAGGLHGDQAFPAARHQCPGGEAHFVGVTVVEDEQWRGRRCLWAHPIENATLTIRWDKVPLGRVLRGYATIPFWHEREKKGAPVDMEVLAGGDSIGRYRHTDGDGWKRFEFSTGAHAGTEAPVEFRVRTARARLRQFCFQADSR